MPPKFDPNEIKIGKNIVFGVQFVIVFASAYEDSLLF